jgi:hypothetical protein
VQVDPIRLALKPPGTERLKLECDNPLSDFAFKFNLRRYSMTHAHMRARYVLTAVGTPGPDGQVPQGAWTDVVVGRRCGGSP